jgi:hypothetical protein
VINPVEPTGCTPDTLGDPQHCLRCVKNTQCGSAPCGGETCIRCPGQDAGDLPASCNGTTTCPDGQQACNNGACAEGTYCASGCCVGVIL